ncbi:F-box domain protein [Opisthorchis viverrini]|uniref:Uncharacterized protein n=2 Tax=Opisthorchis viverrini TaxID=6198 RepID=A0A074ZPR8_OPIVI|nr:hypothetical protein T265_04185 [Opisthorchis viverrini]KER29091.1 hypothetical protein T265_04185 [Opisthorchis viverrini]OON20701.1 F-box domain protein [Opisthorchis viverrini]
MPFLSPDWRYPGDRWLRSSECGSLWENAKIYRLRMFERMNETVVRRQSLIEDTDQSMNYVNDLLRVVIYQPHVYLRIGTVRDVVTTTTISEALIGLDLKAAIRDVRRFNYVCKIIQILLKDHFHRLTGRLQLFLIELLRAILSQGNLPFHFLPSELRFIVQASCNQTAMLRQLLSDLLDNLERNKYDHIGSAILWDNHRKAVDEMNAELDGFDIEKCLRAVAKEQRSKPLSASEWTPSTADDVSLEKLPTECLSRVLSFVNSPRDLETASLASGAIASLVEEDHLWRNLTLTHFDMEQMSSVHFGRPGWRDEPPATMDDCNWRRAYLRLLKRYGDQHFYTAKLAACEVCCCIFWPLFGHPCHYPKQEPRLRLLSPEDFIALFPI